MCSFNVVMLSKYFFSGTMFFILFSNFWIQAYTKKRSRKSKTEVSNGNGVKLPDDDTSYVKSLRKRAVVNSNDSYN